MDSERPSPGPYGGILDEGVSIQWSDHWGVYEQWWKGVGMEFEPGEDRRAVESVNPSLCVTYKESPFMLVRGPGEKPPGRMKNPITSKYPPVKARRS